MRRSERINKGRPPQFFGIQQRVEKSNKTLEIEDELQAARIRYERLLAEEKVKELELQLRTSLQMDAGFDPLTVQEELGESVWKNEDYRELLEPENKSVMHSTPAMETAEDYLRSFTARHQQESVASCVRGEREFVSFGSFGKKADREHDEDPLIDLGLCTHQKSEDVFFEDEPCTITSTHTRPPTHSTARTYDKHPNVRHSCSISTPARSKFTSMQMQQQRTVQRRSPCDSAADPDEASHVHGRVECVTLLEKCEHADVTVEPAKVGLQASSRPAPEVLNYKSETTAPSDVSNSSLSTAVSPEAALGTRSGPEGVHVFPNPVKSSVAPTEGNSIEMLAKAINELSKNAQPKDNEEMRRFVARRAVESRELPTFSGLPEEWPVFFEHYEASTRECQFSDAENMARLRKALKGRAREAVSALLALPGNVTNVMRTLQRRFGRPDFIVQSLIEKAKGMPAVREGDLLALIDFGNAVGNLVSTMELVRSEGHLANPELRQQLLGKLPHALQLRWGENLSAKSEVEKGGTTLREFAKWLGERADAASLIVSQKEVGVQRSEPKKEKQSLGTTHCFQVGMDCKEAEKQLAELPLNQRREFPLKKGLCFNCLRANHRVWQCRARSGCTKCKRKHHELLHGAQPQTPTRSLTPQNTSPSASSSIRTFGCRANTEVVQLMTTVAEVAGVRRARVRTFLDLGSQASFVSEDLVNAVKPRLVRVEDLSVSAFGTAPVVSKSEPYELSLKTVDGHSIALQAWKRKNLPVDIEVVPNGLVEQWKAKGVTLTDSPAADVDPGIHVLLGADVASDLLVQKVVSERGESAWRTKIGWVLSGKRAPQPHEQLSSTTAVAFCDVKTAEEKIERLWAIEDLPVEKEGCQRPAFPVTKVDKTYEVGLLWRGMGAIHKNGAGRGLRGTFAHGSTLDVWLVECGREKPTFGELLFASFA